MYKDLQIQILEDVAATCILVVDPPPDSFVTIKVGDPTRWMKRRRPDELLDQLRRITRKRPQGPWYPTELLKELGWTVDLGGAVSVGKAMKLLGWGVKQKTNKRKVVYVK